MFCVALSVECGSHYTHCTFLFNATATTHIYTLSLHDALPISPPGHPASGSLHGLGHFVAGGLGFIGFIAGTLDRKSTRLNSSHANISYAVFCLKKKKNKG